MHKTNHEMEAFEQLSLEDISFEGLSESATALLDVLSVLDGARITEDLLRKGAEPEKDMLVDNFPTTESEYIVARNALQHRSIVLYSTDTHDLSIQQFVQEEFGRHRKHLGIKHDRKVILSAILLLREVCPEVTGADPSRNLAWRKQVTDKYIPHIQRIKSLCTLEIVGDTSIEWLPAADLFIRYSWIMAERGNPEETYTSTSIALPILKSSMFTAEVGVSSIVKAVADCYHHLSFAALYTDSSDGMSFAKKWLEMIEKYEYHWDSKRKRKRDLATAYNQIGLCHIKEGNPVDAKNCWVRSMELYGESVDEPELAGVWPAINLALQRVLDGQAEKAANALVPIMEKRSQVLGEDDKTTSESGAFWRAMGHVRNAQQMYKQGFECHLRALANLKETLDDDHYMTADCHYDIGMDLVREGKKQEAILHFEASVNAFDDTRCRRAQKARALWQQGQVLLKLKGDEFTDRGSVCIKLAMEIRGEVLPKDARTEEDLKDQDWDEPIFFYSR